MKALFRLWMALSLLDAQKPVLQAERPSEQPLEHTISAMLEGGQVDRALSLARQAVQSYPQSPVFRQMLGAAAFKKGLKEEARDAFQNAIHLDPNNAENQFDLALVELSDNRYAAALKPLEACVRLAPDNAQAHLLLGRTYHNLNQTLPAIDQFRKAATLSPTLPLVHYHLGYAYQSQGDLDSAFREFQQEIQVNSRFYDSYWLAGEIALGRGSLSTAAELFRKGIMLSAGGFQARYGLGRVEIALRDFASAEAELEQALAANSDSIEAHYALAQAYLGAGQREQAAREFRLVSELNARRQATSSGIAGREVSRQEGPVLRPERSTGAR